MPAKQPMKGSEKKKAGKSIKEKRREKREKKQKQQLLTGL
jgi:hypothetical protein